MPKTDPDPLGDRFRWRLRAELNRIQPRYSSPRYLSSARLKVPAWRLAPAALAIGLVCMLGLTAYATTGSANPVVWTKKIVNVIQANESTPLSVPSSTPSPGAAAPAPVAPPTHHDAEPTSSPEPAESPEPTQSPEPTASPEPSHGDHSTEPSPPPGDD